MKQRRHKIRIIGGEYRSRMIDVIDADGLRPTSSRMRETLFNWLQQTIQGTIFIDLFSGSGAIGIEALSRGAKKCYFIEKDHTVYHQLKKNIETLKIEADRYEIIQIDALRWLEINRDTFFIGEMKKNSQKLHLFIDPPFENSTLYEDLSQSLASATLLKQCSDLIIETPIKSHLQSKLAFIDSFTLSREMSTKESLVQYYLQQT